MARAEWQPAGHPAREAAHSVSRQVVLRDRWKKPCERGKAGVHSQRWSSEALRELGDEASRACWETPWTSWTPVAPMPPVAGLEPCGCFWGGGTEIFPCPRYCLLVCFCPLDTAGVIWEEELQL